MAKETLEAAIVRMRDAGATFSTIAEMAEEEYDGEHTRHSVRGIYERTRARKPDPRPAKQWHNDRILVISDMHEPYGHPDTLRFLTAVAEKYKPTRVICMGDEVDKHAMSFHDHDPDLKSPGDELKAAIKNLSPLYKLFPVVDLLDSNHGSLAFRRAKTSGIARKYLRDYGDVLDAPKGWVWHHDLHVVLPTGNDCYFHHGLSSNALQVVERRGVCVVQGHFHSQFAVQYSGNPKSLLWSMQVGCAIDKDSLAFAYDNANLPRPILGHGIIIDGHPKLLPMVLNTGGRWNGYVP